jgi:hypothetical protein
MSDIDINQLTESDDTTEKAKDISLDKDKIYIFDNPEKSEKIRLGPADYMPYNCSRILCSGLPNCGKRGLIFNIIFRMNPKPSAIHLCHVDTLCTEYDQLSDICDNIYIYSPEDFPTIHNIENPEEVSSDDDHQSKDLDKNPLVIVDEITTDQLGKKGAARFERMVNHVCTHRNTTLICSIQSILSIPQKIRRSFSQFAIWKQTDRMLNKLIASRCGVDSEFLDDLFKLCQTKHDFIYIDLDRDRDDPMRYRLNWIYPIIIKEVKDGNGKDGNGKDEKNPPK